MYNFSTLSSTMVRILLRTGDLDSQTTYTSDLKTIKFTSEHLGIPNAQINLMGVYLKIVPSGNDSLYFTCTADNQFDEQRTFTVATNPFSYPLLNSFTLASSANDSTASTLARDDDPFTLYEQVDISGKSIEVQIQTTGSRLVDTQLIGLEGEFIVEEKNPEYV